MAGKKSSYIESVKSKFSGLAKNTPAGVKSVGSDVGDNLGVMGTAAALKAADNTDLGRQAAGLTGGRLEVSDLAFVAACVARVTGLDAKIPGGRKVGTATIKAMTTLYAAGFGARTPDAVREMIRSSKKALKISGTEETVSAPVESTGDAATQLVAATATPTAAAASTAAEELAVAATVPVDESDDDSDDDEEEGAEDRVIEEAIESTVS